MKKRQGCLLAVLLLVLVPGAYWLGARFGFSALGSLLVVEEQKPAAVSAAVFPVATKPVERSVESLPDERGEAVEIPAESTPAGVAVVSSGGPDTEALLAATQEAERLQAVVEKLTGQMAELKLEAETYRDRYEKAMELGEVGPLAAKAVDSGEWVLVDADPGRGLAAMGAGSLQGVKPGLQCLALRNGALVARMEIVEVRERISALAVRETYVEGFVESGDRVVPSTAGTGGK